MSTMVQGSVHELFELQAAAHAEAVAVICGADVITAGAIETRANQLARHLQRLGVRCDDRVALLVDYNADMIVASLAAIKAGGAYAAIDATWPRAVIEETLRACEARVLVRSRASVVVEQFDGPIVSLDEDYASLAEESSAPLAIAADPEQLFSVVYTSGTSGNPKGVLVKVRAVCNRLCWMWDVHPYRHGDVSLLYRSHAGIGFTWDCFGPLLKGIPILIAPAPNIRDVRELLAIAVNGGVSHVSSSPSRWDTLLEYIEQRGVRWPTLRFARSSGEPLRPETVQRWRRACPQAALVNVYGSTECSSSTSCDALETPFAGRVPVGAPVPNVTIRLLDETMSPVPRGEVGEICVGGACLARGYLNRPALTAERFVPDPDAPTAGARLFRTGDSGVLRADGLLEIVGRRDHRVNVRGFRVELEAVEAALRSCAGVRQAAVTADEPRPGDTQLTAYIVMEDGAMWSPADLRAQLSDRVRDYMVPSTFVPLREMPLTATGKIARQALAACAAIAVRETAHGRATPIAPQTPAECQLADIWRRVLAVDSIGVEDDFFALGGHSLLAMQILARVYEPFDVELPLDTFFSGPTVRLFAQAIAAARSTEGPR